MEKKRDRRTVNLFQKMVPWAGLEVGKERERSADGEGIRKMWCEKNLRVGRHPASWSTAPGQQSRLCAQCCRSLLALNGPAIGAHHSFLSCWPSVSCASSMLLVALPALPGPVCQSSVHVCSEHVWKGPSCSPTIDGPDFRARAPQAGWRGKNDPANPPSLMLLVIRHLLMQV